MSKFKKIIRLVLVVICIFYLARFFYINKDSLQITFALSSITVFSVVSLALLHYFLSSCRFQIVLKKCSGTSISVREWFKIFILGKLLNTFLPQAGNVYRSVQLKKDYDISYTNYISSLASFAWMDTSMNLIIATAVIAILNSGLTIGPFSAWKILTFLTIVVVALPVLTEVLLGKINFKNKHLHWVHSKLSEVMTASVKNIRDKVYLLKIVFLGLAMLACTGALLHICFRIFNINLSLPTLAVFYALLKISHYVSLTPGNLGVQELAYGFLGEQMGIGMAQGVLASALIRVVGTSVLFALGMLFGGGDLLRHRKDYSKMED